MKKTCRVSTVLVCIQAAAASRILMMTLGGTRSHKVPFLALGRGLVARGHNVTLFSAFPPGQPSPIEEITPTELVETVESFSNMDVLGRKLRGKSAYSVFDIINYTYKVCEAFYSTPDSRRLLSRKVDLLILDGAFPECLLALALHFNSPFVFLNTVAYHTVHLSAAGNPTLPSVTPFFDSDHSDRMDLWERSLNGLYHAATHLVAVVINEVFVEPIVRKHLGPEAPPNSVIGRNVSLILQNGHHTVTYPRPFLPAVIEVACLQCTHPEPLTRDLEEFVRGGTGRGFIYVGFGTSLRSSQVPEELRLLLVKVFSSLPYQVLWKYETRNASVLELPGNVRVGQWFPQQDLLGHPMIKGFVNHGGLHGVFEAVFHRVPMVLLPVFCDHAVNSRKARDDGYAEVLDWQGLTAEDLLATINKVIDDKRYKENVIQRSILLQDQPEPPLARALYWVDYVLRHRGASHLQGAAKDLTLAQYFMLDSLAVLVILIYVSIQLSRITWRKIFKRTKNVKAKQN